MDNKQLLNQPYEDHTVCVSGGDILDSGTLHIEGKLSMVFSFVHNLNLKATGN